MLVDVLVNDHLKWYVGYFYEMTNRHIILSGSDVKHNCLTHINIDRVKLIRDHETHLTLQEFDHGTI